MRYPICLIRHLFLNRRHLHNLSRSIHKKQHEDWKRPFFLNPICAKDCAQLLGGLAQRRACVFQDPIRLKKHELVRLKWRQPELLHGGRKRQPCRKVEGRMATAGGGGKEGGWCLCCGGVTPAHS